MQRLVEGLRFAVGLGPEGARTPQLHFENGGGSGEGVRAIAAAIVRDHPLHADAHLREGQRRTHQEVGSGWTLLVRKRFSVGVAAVVVDGTCR